MRDLISAIDAAHARISPYAHHLRVLLSDQKISSSLRRCRIAQCEPRPIRVLYVDARVMGFISHRDISQAQRWIKTMDWKNTFQVSAYLRFGLLTIHDLFHTLQEPIEQVWYQGTRVLALVSVALKMREVDEELEDLFARTRSNHLNIKEGP